MGDSIPLRTLRVGDRGYVTGLGPEYSFIVEDHSPGGTKVRFDRRRVDTTFEVEDDEGKKKPVRFIRPAKGEVISSGAMVTKLATDTEDPAFKQLMDSVEAQARRNVASSTRRTKVVDASYKELSTRDSIAPRLLSLPEGKSRKIKRKQ